MNSTPQILKEGNYDLTDIEIIKKNPIYEIIDLYESQLTELFEITNPTLITSPKFASQKLLFLKQKKGQNPNLQGDWIYFPDSKYLIHSLKEEDYQLLRTNRNKNIVTKEEQQTLYNSCIGFIGLSIGSHFALSLAYSAIGNQYKLADFDTLQTSNLNRIKAGLKDVGRPKTDIVASQIWQINPYAKLKLFKDGLTPDNLKNFIYEEKKPSLIFEAIDDLKMKIKLRIEAKKAKIPVVMLTNLGDSVMVDIERYDLEPKLEIFNGLIGNTPEELLTIDLKPSDIVKYVVKIVGIENIPTRALRSLTEINKNLVGRPQLFSTVSIAGGLGAYIAKRILLDKSLKSGRFKLAFSQIFNVEDIDENDNREKLLTFFKEKLNL